MTLEEYRESFINDINTEALSTSRYPTEVFIDYAVDILKMTIRLFRICHNVIFRLPMAQKHIKICILMQHISICHQIH